MSELRVATPGDVAAVCEFGEAHIRPHYAPLIGAAAADEQVRGWWSETAIDAAVAGGLGDHVVYKLYVDPRQRGHGLGPRLLGALVGQLPDNADRLCIEHFAANERAGAFYEREGFTVDRVEASPTGDPALGIVWRSRRVTPRSGARDRLR